MTNLLLLQQQQAELPCVFVDTCWEYWPASTIAEITQCPTANVACAWPAIHAELEARGIASRSVCSAAIGTIAIETASSFRPVREAFWLSEDWRRANLRYFPWYGRGYIQLTWESNYDLYGRAIGVDLLADADLALEPAIAAKIFAEYFLRSGAAAAAERNDCTECRRRVQGGSASLERLLRIVDQLGA